MIEYLELGRGEFSSRNLKTTTTDSLHAAAAHWVAGSDPSQVGARMALRETAHRCFGAALALGCISPRWVSGLAAAAGGPRRLVADCERFTLARVAHGSSRRFYAGSGKMP